MTRNRALKLSLSLTLALVAVAAARTFAVAGDPPPSPKPSAGIVGAGAKAGSETPRVFEMRTYYTHPGRLDALNKRFSEHTCALFKKHGIDLVGFWTPKDEKDGKADKLVYIIAFPSREAAEASWKAFREDPEWKAAQKASEADGPIVKKVDSVFLDPTGYSPVK